MTPSKEVKAITKTLEYRRKQLNKSYYFVATQSNMKLTQVKEILTGQAGLTTSSLLAICGALDLTVKVENK